METNTQRGSHITKGQIQSIDVIIGVLILSYMIFQGYIEHYARLYVVVPVLIVIGVTWTIVKGNISKKEGFKLEPVGFKTRMVWFIAALIVFSFIAYLKPDLFK